MQNLGKNNQAELLHLFEVEELEARLENKWGKEPDPIDVDTIKIPASL